MSNLLPADTVLEYLSMMLVPAAAAAAADEDNMLLILFGDEVSIEKMLD